MSRRICTKKRFPLRDSTYDNFLVSLLINRILKKGKKELARRIVYKSLNLLKEKTKKNPLSVLEKAIQNVSPKVQLKSKPVEGATYQLPTLLTRFRSINIAIKWIIQGAMKHGLKKMYLKLTMEIFDASKKLGHAYKKREDTHKIAEANRTFS